MTYVITDSDMDFIRESNAIEGITRNPTLPEIAEFERFMALDRILITDLCHFVSVYQSGAALRVREGLNVRVGNYFPPKGGPAIGYGLANLLESLPDKRGICADAYTIHQAYEALHPFTDGNGRSGRMIWRWMLPNDPLGFLHRFYYEALAAHPTR